MKEFSFEKIKQYDDELKTIEEKIKCLKEKQSSLGMEIADLSDASRELLSERSKYIINNRIIGNDNAYAIAYTPTEIYGCGDLLRIVIVRSATPNKAYAGLRCRSFLYRYLDGEYRINIEDVYLSSLTHEVYEKERLVYRIQTEDEYNNIVLSLVKEDMDLSDIHNYLNCNFKLQNDKK